MENEFHVQEDGIPIAIESEVMEEVHNEIDLSPEDLAMLTRLKELVISDTKPIFNLKSFNRFDVMAQTTSVNNLLKYFSPSNITETRNLIQAASSLVGELLGAKKHLESQNRSLGGKDELKKIMTSSEKISR